MKAINQTNRDFASLSPAVQRASTVVFDSLDAFVNRKHRQPDGFSYGVTGTLTARLLADRIGLHESFVLPLLCYLYIVFYGIWGSRLRGALAEARA